MADQVKVTNNTKGAKGSLAQFRLVDVELECCGQMVAPGSSITMPAEDWSLASRSYDRLVKLGAFSVEEVTGPKAVGPALVSLDDKVESKRSKRETSTEG